MVRPDASPKAGKFNGTLSRCQLSHHLRMDRFDALREAKDAEQRLGILLTELFRT
jgi:hypothetical protein